MKEAKMKTKSNQIKPSENSSISVTTNSVNFNCNSLNSVTLKKGSNFNIEEEDKNRLNLNKTENISQIKDNKFDEKIKNDVQGIKGKNINIERNLTTEINQSDDLNEIKIAKYSTISCNSTNYNKNNDILKNISFNNNHNLNKDIITNVRINNSILNNYSNTINNINKDNLIRNSERHNNTKVFINNFINLNRQVNNSNYEELTSKIKNRKTQNNSIDGKFFFSPSSKVCYFNSFFSLCSPKKTYYQNHPESQNIKKVIPQNKKK